MTINLNEFIYLIKNNWYFLKSSDLNVLDLFDKHIIVFNLFDKKLKNYNNYV